jgi:hypothetical protein
MQLPRSPSKRTVAEAILLPQRPIELNGHNVARTSMKEVSQALPAYEHEHARRLTDVANYLKRVLLPERKFWGGRKLWGDDVGQTCFVVVDIDPNRRCARYDSVAN